MIRFIDLESMTPEILCADIERAAGEVGLSIWALCHEAKTHPTTFSKWKTGHAEPSFRIVRKMIEVIQSKAPKSE
jgi:hypothetical protein